MPGPFRFMDCAITTLALGRSAQNLRELRHAIAEIPLQSLSHHFYESLLLPVFDDPEYRNDFAVWARRQLRDNSLAERLGAIDPMEFQNLEDLRQHLLDVIEDRLAESPTLLSTAPGHEFHFLTSKRVILDTGRVAETPADMAARLPRIPTGSVYYHFVESRRRPPPRVDDFSAWLQDWGPDYDPYREAIAAIDYHLWSLTELRALLARCLWGIARVDGG